MSYTFQKDNCNNYTVRFNNQWLCYIIIYESQFYIYSGTVGTRELIEIMRALYSQFPDLPHLKLFKYRLNDNDNNQIIKEEIPLVV